MIEPEPVEAPLSRYTIPDPVLELVVNRSGWPHMRVQKMGMGRRFYDVVVVKTSYLLGPSELVPSTPPRPGELVDRTWERPAARSSLKCAGDLLWTKPGGDLFVTGTAATPTERPERRWQAGVRVELSEGQTLQHLLHVTGPRAWQKRAMKGYRLSEAEPALEVPIRYELAYGGSRKVIDDQGQTRYVVHRPNPSGRGFVDEATLTEGEPIAAPQWEAPGDPVRGINETVESVGFGPVARMWASRLRYAGTRDAAFVEKLRREAGEGLVADYPADFDTRFFQCAPPALIAQRPFRGGEAVALLGLLLGRETLAFRLPRERLVGFIHREHRDDERPFACDTVHIDLDEGLVALTHRLTLPAEDRAFGLTIELRTE